MGAVFSFNLISKQNISTDTSTLFFLFHVSIKTILAKKKMGPAFYIQCKCK